MWIQVRSMDGKTSHRIDGLSKLTKIEDLREKLEELHKIIYGKVDITRENYLQENDRRMRGSTRFYQERIVDKDLCNSYFPKTIRDWNQLPVDCAMTESLDTFKRHLAERTHTETPT